VSAQIKRYKVVTTEYARLFVNNLPPSGDYVSLTDHLASMAAASAYDEEKERRLFEVEMVFAGVDCTRRVFGEEAEDQGLIDGDYYGLEARTGWHYWKACAKARAKAGGE
jgi:hypothetical protein